MHLLQGHSALTTMMRRKQHVMNLSNMAILLLSWGSVWESVKLRVRGVAMEGAICWAILIGSC